MLGFMKCVAEAIAANGVQGLLDLVPGGNYVYAVGADALRRYREKNAQKRLEDDIKQMIEAKADAALAFARQAVDQAVPQLPQRDKERVVQYLAALPEAARQSMKRKDDPTGRSLPFGYTIHTAEDVVKVLPQYPPRFTPGEWVPGREENWRLVDRLGGGGFGEVWLAQHAWKAEMRAVKFCTDPAARHRLTTHEKELIVRVMRHTGDHPNIVPLLECHLVGDTPWLMYEYVRGGTLTDQMLEWAKQPTAERLNRAIPVLHRLAAAVGHLHTLDPAIVHRDLKPANVLVDGSTPRITDFGIGGTTADLAIAEQTKGRPTNPKGVLPTILSGSYSLLYASKQQRDGEKPHPRDDVHALGVIAYQMLTGDLSSAPGSDVADELKDLGIPDGLITLISRSVAQNPDRRPKDATEWEKTLAGWVPGKPVAPLPRIDPQPQVDEERAERMELWKRSGMPRQWVLKHLDGWGPDDWTALVSGLKSSPYWPLKADELGSYLERLRDELRAERDRQREEERRREQKAIEENPFHPAIPRKAGDTIRISLGKIKTGGILGFGANEIDVEMTFAWCPPGVFQRENHRVTLTKGFYTGIHPVTQAQWKAITGATPSHFKGDTRPVEQVSWDDCQEFCKKLTAHLKGRVTVRLPSEAEWEYACRAGTTTEYHTGDGEAALKKAGWYSGNAGSQTHPVGELAANAWGLHDMHGNVWEWCQDWYGPYAAGDQTDPVQLTKQSNEYRVLRGGSWYGVSASCLAACRGRGGPGGRFVSYGFRCVFRLD
jgi:formylglycine-generating enzyme required for sulfatase activity